MQSAKPTKPRAVVVLETMWGTKAGPAPVSFQINPENHSGRRLYRWLTAFDFVVTNACPQVVTSARQHGKPCKSWLNDNLSGLFPYDLLLVCGRVAQKTVSEATYDRCRRFGVQVLRIPHPAARNWSWQGIDLVTTWLGSGQSGTISSAGGRFVWKQETPPG